MVRNRKVAAIALAVGLGFALVGCSGDANKAEIDETSATETVVEGHEAAPSDGSYTGATVELEDREETDVDAANVVAADVTSTTWVTCMWLKGSNTLDVTGSFSNGTGAKIDWRSLPELRVNGVVADAWLDDGILDDGESGSFTYHVKIDPVCDKVEVTWGGASAESDVDMDEVVERMEPGFAVNLADGIDEDVVSEMSRGIASLISASKVDAIVGEMHNGGLYTVTSELTFEGGHLVVRGSVTNNTDVDANDVVIGAVVLETAAGRSASGSYGVADGEDATVDMTFSELGVQTVRAPVVLTFDTVAAHETVEFEQVCDDVTAESVAGTLSFELGDVIGFTK